MAAFNWFQRSYEEPEKPKEEEKPKAEEKAEAAPASPEDYLKWAKAAYQNIQERQGGGESSAESAATAELEETKEPEAKEPEAKEPEETAEPSAPEQTEDATADVAVSAEAITVEAETSGTESGTKSAEAEPEASSEPEPVPTESTKTETTPAEVNPDEPLTEPLAEVPIRETPAEVVEESSDSQTDDSQMEPTAAATATQPFWAKAQTEREERLERLQSEAILEPEPEPEPAPPEPEFVPLDIDLDEAFLWSAEVLASQGRRPDQISLEEITWLNKLRQGLDKTRRGLVNQLKSIVGQGPLNDEAVDEIESLLLQADVGVAATDKIISALQTRLKEETLPPEQAIAYLKSLLRDILDEPLAGGHNLTFTPEKDQLSIWLMTGVNGAGKTTTIGKLTHIATKSGFKCLIGAADTFRAAAVEQVKIWGERSGVEVIANPGQNTDPAAVVFDAISAANSRGTELLLIDTAGRLQNKKNLMDELSKVRKIIDKKAPNAKVESLLVLDATLGQNGLRQAQVFSEAAQLSGVVLTKLDGTARGGVALAVVQQLGLPIRFIGAGEGIEDLRPFSSYEFVEALLNG
ncbi:MAG: signal recognition particle-docking protein FtsY [Phormidesmis sp.]